MTRTPARLVGGPGDGHAIEVEPVDELSVPHRLPTVIRVEWPGGMVEPYRLRSGTGDPPTYQWAGGGADETEPDVDPAPGAARCPVCAAPLDADDPAHRTRPGPFGIPIAVCPLLPPGAIVVADDTPTQEDPAHGRHD